MPRSTLLPKFTILAAVLPLIACGGPPKPVTDGSSPASSAATPATGATDEAPTAPEPPPSAEMDRGTKAFDAKDWATAEAAFVTATKKNPKDFRAWVDLGLTFEKEGKPDQAETAFKSALDVRPDLPEATVELAAMEIDAGKPDEAIARCRRALESHKSHAGLHNALGLALAKKGSGGADADAALKELETAVKLKPNEPMFHLSLAQMLNASKVKGAVPHLDEAARLAGDDVPMLATIAHEYRMGGAFQECVSLYDRIVAKQDAGELRTERALCKRGLKDDAGALQDLKDAVAKFPAYPAAHVYLGMRYAAQKQWKDAVSEYERFLKLAPDDPRAGDVKQKLAAAKAAMAGK